jgi:hypothetical protein
MRKILNALPLLLCASPAFAQSAPRLPPQLTDPATAQKLTNAMQALSGVFLNMKVGEVQAALEGRQATPAERNMTVRDMARRDDPEFDRHFQQQMANIGPTVQRSMQALNQALPAMMKGLHDAEKSLDRAVANMPDPTYPKR